MTDKTDSKEREAFVEWMIADVLRCATKPVSDGMRDALRQTASRVWDSGEELVVRGWKARASLAASAASAGSEPVATVFTMEALAPGGGVKYHATVHKPLPAGTKLYLHPSPPEGMVMVPREPTMAMRIAAKTADMDHTNLSDWMVSDWPEFKRIWDAMLKAAPPTTSAGSGKGE